MNRQPLHLAFFGTFALLLSSCATFGTPGESPETKESSEDPASRMKVDDEVPNVSNCHTDTQICELEESLQPGLGCFCKKADGTNETGIAGE